MKELKNKEATIVVRRKWRWRKKIKVDLGVCDLAAWSLRNPKSRISPTRHAPDVEEVITITGKTSLINRMVSASRGRGYALTIVKGRRKQAASLTDFVLPGETVEIRFK